MLKVKYANIGQLGPASFLIEEKPKNTMTGKAMRIKNKCYLFFRKMQAHAAYIPRSQAMGLATRSCPPMYSATLPKE